MSADEPKRNRITRNLRLAYESIACETIPERFQDLLRRMDDGDDLDPGVGAELPQRPRGGPRSSGAAAIPNAHDRAK